MTQKKKVTWSNKLKDTAKEVYKEDMRSEVEEEFEED